MDRNPNNGGEGPKWVAPRRSKPGLCVFNVTTACLYLSAA